MLLPRRLDVNVQAEQAKGASAPFANVDSGSEATTACFRRFSTKEENLYVAECPEVGTVSQGYTVGEAVANLKEATELYLVETGIVEEDVRTSLEQVKGLIEKLRAKVSER